MQMALVLVVYGVALMHVFQGHPEHRLVLICALVMATHLLEIPVAFYMLKGRNAQPLRVASVSARVSSALGPPCTSSA